MNIFKLKFLELKFWQVFAFISGTIIALAMGLASISYSATLGTDELAFPVLPLTNALLFSFLAFAFELGMIASVFGFWHWRASNPVAATICLALFAISSAYSVHAVRGYILVNITKAESTDARVHKIVGSIKFELDDAQSHLSALRTALLKSHGRRRSVIARDIKEQRLIIQTAREQLARTKVAVRVAPMVGLEWSLALTLWFFNATCWTAWFGTRENSEKSLNSSKALELRAPNGVRYGAQVELLPSHSDPGGTAIWLASYAQAAPEHCAQLYEHYLAWCTAKNIRLLADRKFYARLIALGARKFRDGRNGPTLYQLPPKLVEHGDPEAGS